MTLRVAHSDSVLYIVSLGRYLFTPFFFGFGLILSFFSIRGVAASAFLGTEYPKRENRGKIETKYRNFIEQCE